MNGLLAKAVRTHGGGSPDPLYPLDEFELEGATMNDEGDSLEMGVDDVL